MAKGKSGCSTGGASAGSWAWVPPGRLSPAGFLSERTFRNARQAVVALDIIALPDHVDIVVHSYRRRLGLADGDPRHDRLEQRLAAGPTIAVPTVTLDGEKDPFAPAGDGSSCRDKFTGPYAHRTLKNIGHNVPQEAPGEFARAVLEADGFNRP